MDLLDDSRLLRLYAEARSQSAFAELVRRHLNLVYRSALRQVRGDSHLAEDVSQAVFTLVAQRAGPLSRHPRFVGWLFTTTHHVTSVTLRRERRRQRREKEATAMHENSAAPFPSDPVDSIGPVLDLALRDLSETDREAVLLHFIEGRSFADVGLRLALGEDAARMRVRRALEKLRTKLGRRGVVSSGAALLTMLAQEAASAAPASLVASVSGIALTSATGGAAVGMGIFYLMSTSKFVIGAALILALFAGVESVRIQSQIRAAEKKVLALQAADATKAQRLELFQGTLRSSPRAIPGFKTPGSGLAGIAPGVPALDIATEVAKQRIKRRADVANWELTIRPLLKARGATDQQLADYLTLATKTLSQIDDLILAAKVAGVDPKSDPELMAEGNRAAADFLTNATKILGDANMQFMKDKGTDPSALQKGEAGYVATQVAGLTFNSATPMTMADRQQLIDLIASNSPHYAPGDDNSIDTIYWNQLVAQAETFLNAAEISALKALQADTARWDLKKQVNQVAAAAVQK